MIRVAFIVGDYPSEERKLREDVAKSFASAEVEVGIVSVPPAPFGGLGPAEIQLVAPYYHAGYLQAEREGYDVHFVPFQYRPGSRTSILYTTRRE